MKREVDKLLAIAALILLLYFYYLVRTGTDTETTLQIESEVTAIVAKPLRKTVFTKHIRTPKPPETVQKRDSVNGEGRDEQKACNLYWKTDWEAIKKAGKPLIYLDSSRFLYPVLVNGPNNQLIGLRDSLYLAVRLNRTLILPQFFKHKTDSSSSSDRQLPASQRIEVATLARFISILPFSEIQNNCFHGFDSLFFNSYKSSKSSLAKVEESIGVPVYKKKTGEHPERYPKNMKTSFGHHNIKSDRDSLFSLYDSPGRCALYAFPFRSVGVKEKSETLRKMYEYTSEENVMAHDMKLIDPNDLQDEDLYSLIVHATPRPKYIHEIVKGFMKEYALEKVSYLAVHWRYDPVDWQHRCTRKDRLLSKGKVSIIEMCDRITMIEPQDLATGIFDFISSLKVEYSIEIQTVYFACPLNMLQFSNEMASSLLKHFADDKEVHIFTQENLHGHLENYFSCSLMKDNYEDVFSQLEMDICSQATVFMRSSTSSWSKVITEGRAMKSLNYYDTSVFEWAWKAAKKRIS